MLLCTLQIFKYSPRIQPMSYFSRTNYFHLNQVNNIIRCTLRFQSNCYVVCTTSRSINFIIRTHDGRRRVSLIKSLIKYLCRQTYYFPLSSLPPVSFLQYLCMYLCLHEKKNHHHLDDSYLLSTHNSFLIFCSNNTKRPTSNFLEWRTLELLF